MISRNTGDGFSDETTVITGGVVAPGRGSFFFRENTLVITRGLNGKQGGIVFFCWHYPRGYIPRGGEQKTHTIIHTPHMTSRWTKSTSSSTKKGKREEDKLLLLSSH